MDVEDKLREDIINILNKTAQKNIILEEIKNLQTSLKSQIQNGKLSSDKTISGEDFELILIDGFNYLLNQIDIQIKSSANLESIPENQEKLISNKKILVELIRSLFQADILSYKTLLNNLDESYLENAGMLGSSISVQKIVKDYKDTSIPLSEKIGQIKQNFKIPNLDYYQKKFVRYNTRNLYEQEKFNLQREENEGYAKLVVQLNQPNIIYVKSKEEIHLLYQNIQQLVGYFNLDPNRVIDITLEAFENKILFAFGRDIGHMDIKLIDQIKDVFFELLNPINLVYQQPDRVFKNMNREKIISSILGFKLQDLLHNIKIDLNKDAKDLIPYSLLLLISLLVQNGSIQVENIWPYFIRQNKVVSAELGVIFVDEVIDEVQQYHQDYQKILDQKYQQLDKNILDNEFKISENLRFKNEMTKIDKLRREKIPYNLQLWFVACLIKVNDFQDAELVIGSIWGDEKLDLTIHKELLQNLFQYLDVMIDQLYSELPSNQQTPWQKLLKVRRVQKNICDNAKGIKICRNSEDLVENLPKVFRILGVHLGLNSIIFMKLLKVVNYYLIENQPLENIKNFAYKLAGEYFLPALCITRDHNYSLDVELWKILKQINFTTRYFYYQELISRGYLTNLSLLSKLIELYPKASKWTKSISDSDDKDLIYMMRKEAGKIANSGNCLIMGNNLIRTCSNYNNLIKPFIQVMEKDTFNQLSLDMVAFSILRNLVEKQDQYSQIDSEGFVPQSLNYISKFTSLFFKTFSTVDLLPLTTYISNRMREGNNFYETIILSGILSSMFGWKDLEINILNDKQLQSLAGGMWLKLEIMGLTNEFKKTKTTAEALTQLFYQDVNSQLEQNNKVNLTLAFRTMVYLAQITQFINYELECKDIILIQNTFDNMQQIFMQFVDTLFFLKEDRQMYQKLLPDRLFISEILSINYKLPYQYSYHIIRRSSQPLQSMNAQQFENIVRCYCSIFETSLQNRIYDYGPSDKKTSPDNDWDDYPYWDEVKYLEKVQKTQNWNRFSKQVFTIFWQLELQDIALPSEMYEELIKEKSQALDDVNNQIKQLVNIQHQAKGGSNLQDNMSTSQKEQLKKHQREVDRLQKLQNNLKSEFNDKQRKNYQQVQNFLKSRLSDYFEQIPEENGISHFLVQHCFYPRLMFSPSDALYSIKFLKMLVELKVPKISLLNIFTHLLKATTTIHCCTNNEAENLGIFFMEWFQMIDRWNQNPLIWQQECADYSGFRRYIGQADLVIEIIEFDYYQEVVKQIYTRFCSCLKACLQNPKQQVMKIRCALKILFRIRSVFPKDKQIAESILEDVDKIIAIGDGIQKDVKTLAQRYHQNLTELIPKLADRKKTAAGTSGQAQNKVISLNNSQGLLQSAFNSKSEQKEKENQGIQQDKKDGNIQIKKVQDINNAMKKEDMTELQHNNDKIIVQKSNSQNQAQQQPQLQNNIVNLQKIPGAVSNNQSQLQSTQVVSGEKNSLKKQANDSNQGNNNEQKQQKNSIRILQIDGKNIQMEREQVKISIENENTIDRDLNKREEKQIEKHQVLQKKIVHKTIQIQQINNTLIIQEQKNSTKPLSGGFTDVLNQDKEIPLIKGNLRDEISMNQKNQQKVQNTIKNSQNQILYIKDIEKSGSKMEKSKSPQLKNEKHEVQIIQRKIQSPQNKRDIVSSMKQNRPHSKSKTPPQRASYKRNIDEYEGIRADTSINNSFKGMLPSNYSSDKKILYSNMNVDKSIDDARFSSIVQDAVEFSGAKYDQKKEKNGNTRDVYKDFNTGEYEAVRELKINIPKNQAQEQRRTFTSQRSSPYRMAETNQFPSLKSNQHVAINSRDKLKNNEIQRFADEQPSLYQRNIRELNSNQSHQNMNRQPVLEWQAQAHIKMPVDSQQFQKRMVQDDNHVKFNQQQQNSSQQIVQKQIQNTQCYSQSQTDQNKRRKYSDNINDQYSQQHFNQVSSNSWGGPQGKEMTNNVVRPSNFNNRGINEYRDPRNNNQRGPPGSNSDNRGSGYYDKK